MGIDQSLFNDLAENYGRCSSWAIWNPEKPAATQIIAEHLTCLKTSVVMIGLNLSRHVPDTWENFHGTDLARRLMYAFNDSPYRGAYMTDIIKEEVESSSGRISERIRNGSIDVQKHINEFCTEMFRVGANRHSLFIVFGKDAYKFFTSHFAVICPNHVLCPHYSDYTRYSDAGWVEASWSILETHYKATKLTLNTLEFVRTQSMEAQLQKLMDKQNRRK